EHLSDVGPPDGGRSHIAQSRHQIALDDPLVRLPGPLTLLCVLGDVALCELAKGLSVPLLPLWLGRVDALLGRPQRVLGEAAGIGEIEVIEGAEAHAALSLAAPDAIPDQPGPAPLRRHPQPEAWQSHVEILDEALSGSGEGGSISDGELYLRHPAIPLLWTIFGPRYA